jgi:multidrug efflux pump
MAWAIMGGLTAATVLTLIVLPVLYAASYRVREAHPQVESQGDLPSELRKV